MNSDFPQDERMKREAKLTALLLGELHADEVAELSRAMEQDPELAALYERLKFTMELVREGAANPAAQAEGPSAPLKLSAARREKLLASFKTVAPEEFARPRRMADWLMPMAACAVVLVIVASMFLPSLSRAKYKARRAYAGGNYRGEPQLAKNAESLSPARPEAPREQAPSASVAAPIPSTTLIVTREPQNNLAVAPAARPPALTPSTQIILPAEQVDVRAGQAATHVSVTLFENADPVEVGRVLKRFAGEQTNAVAFNADSFQGGNSFQTLSRLGAEADQGKLGRIIETHDKVGTITDGVALLNAAALKKQFAETQNVQPGYPADEYYNGSVSNALPRSGTGQTSYFLADSAEHSSDKVPILGDVPNVGRLYRSDLSVTANDDFRTTTREDVSGLRYFATNAVVASQPLSGDVRVWGSFDTSTNPAVVYSAEDAARLLKGNGIAYTLNGSGEAGLQPGLAGANTFAGRVVTNSGVFQFNNGATHSAELAQEGEQKPTSSTDGLLTSGLRAGAIELPRASAPIAANGGGGGFGGGGAGGGGRIGSLSSTRVTRLPAGGKQVELAAAAAPASQTPATPRVSPADNRALGFDWYLGNQLMTNGEVAASGGTTLADAEVIESKRGAMPTAEALEKLKDTREQNIPTSQLVQDGKLNYQLGKYDDAELKLNEALDRDPSNQAALYYLSLLKQSRVRQVVDERKVASMDRMVSVADGWAEKPPHQILSPRTPPSSSSSNLGNAPATVRGFYEDNLNAVAGATNKIAEYAAAKKELDNAERWREVLALKTEQEKMVSLPRTQIVTIMDPATGNSPAKSSLGEKIRETFSGKVERSARIRVEQERADIAGPAGASVAQGYDPYFIQTEFETIRSDAVLKKVVDSLKLDGGDPSKTDEAVKQLRKNIDLQTVKNTKLIEIGARNEKAEDAAHVANAVAKAYRDYREEQYAALKNRGVNSLQQQLQGQDQQIAALQSNVDKLRVDLNIPDSYANASSSSPLMTADRLRELSSLRIQKEAEYNQQATLLEELKKMDRASLRKALPIAYSDAELNTLKAELDLADQDLIKLETDRVPDNAKVQNAKSAVDDLKRKVDERADGILLGLQSKVVSAKSFLDTITHEMEDAQKNASETASKDAAYLAAKAQLQTLLTQGGRTVDTTLPKPAVPPPTPQPEILTRENAFSTFSLNVSDVSFKLAAASLEKGQMPEPASIRSEEFINAFDYRDPEALPGVPIAFASERARYPFAQNRELLRFSLKTAAAGRQAGRPLNIVLLLDNSGSMERADRVGIIREALRVLAGQLQASDVFSVVTFARTAQLRVNGIPGNQAAAAAEEIAKLTPEGGTNLGDALDAAYETALHHYLANGDNRVVLLTDGAANLGDVQPDALKQKVEAHRRQGVALDCFGIGWEGYNDDLLEVLTRNGDGRYGFINTPEEANTEFVAQIAGALHVAASDVKVQVEFNPKRVASYRQMGYAKHQLTKEQFRDNTVDAAEIAAQEAGNALYTIEVNPEGEGSIATVRVRYKVPGTAEYREQAWDVPYTAGAVAMDQASPAMRLAATASAFSEWLATSPLAAEVSTDRLLNYLNGVPQVYGADKRPAKLEWMIRQARSISGK